MFSYLKNGGIMYIVIQNNIHRAELNAMDEFIEEYFQRQKIEVKVELSVPHSHQGRRNISANYPLVIKKHLETILKVTK